MGRKDKQMFGLIYEFIFGVECPIIFSDIFKKRVVKDIFDTGDILRRSRLNDQQAKCDGKTIEI